jgi:lipoyl(octanoyl) transferase
LVGYPIVSLEPAVDVVAHVRRIEQALVDVCAELGVADAGRVEGRSGVWTNGGTAKVAAIGIRVARGVTMHGFALNCDADLTAYDVIVPCGITDAGVTSLSVLLGRQVSVAEVTPLVERHLARVLDAGPRYAEPEVVRG